MRILIGAVSLLLLCLAINAQPNTQQALQIDLSYLAQDIREMTEEEFKYFEQFVENLRPPKSVEGSNLRRLYDELLFLTYTGPSESNNNLQPKYLGKNIFETKDGKFYSLPSKTWNNIPGIDNEFKKLIDHDEAMNRGDRRKDRLVQVKIEINDEDTSVLLPLAELKEFVDSMTSGTKNAIANSAERLQEYLTEMSQEGGGPILDLFTHLIKFIRSSKPISETLAQTLSRLPSDLFTEASSSSLQDRDGSEKPNPVTYNGDPVTNNGAPVPSSSTTRQLVDNTASQHKSEFEDFASSEDNPKFDGSYSDENSQFEDHRPVSLLAKNAKWTEKPYKYEYKNLKNGFQLRRESNTPSHKSVAQITVINGGATGTTDFQKDILIPLRKLFADLDELDAGFSSRTNRPPFGKESRTPMSFPPFPRIPPFPSFPRIQPPRFSPFPPGFPFQRTG